MPPARELQLTSERSRVSPHASPVANNLAVLDQREERTVVLAPVVTRAGPPIGPDNVSVRA